ELRLGRRGIPRHAERGDPNRIAVPSLRGIDLDHPRERARDGLSPGNARVPVPPRRAMVGRHPEHVFEPHGLLPRHVPHRRLAVRESGFVRRGPHDRANARAERAPLPRPPEARVRSAVEGRAGRPLRRPRAERPVLGSVTVVQVGITSAYAAGSFLANRNPQGDVLWQRVLAFGGTWSPVARAVAPDGTVYFTGQLGANYSGGTVVGKVLPDGTLAFSK